MEYNIHKSTNVIAIENVEVSGHIAKAATLLIVGSYGGVVLNLIRKACNGLTCEKKLEVIRGATHLFPGTGAKETVCGLTADLFELHLHPIQVD